MKYFYFLLLIIPMLVCGQGWEKDFGPGLGYSVQQTNDSGFILTGTLSNAYSISNLALIKTNNNGDSLWTRLYGDTNESTGFFVTQTNDGGFFAGGYISELNQDSIFQNGIFLVKTDYKGDSLWTKKYLGIIGEEFQQTNDGGYVITGYKFNNSSQGIDFIILKTDSNGDTLWTKTYNENNRDYAYSIKQTNDGGYIITGTSIPSGSNYHIYVLKTDSLGNSEWSKTFGEYNQGQAYSIIQNIDGSFILLGYTNNYPSTPEKYEQILLIKMNTVGDTLWTKGFDLHTHNQGYEIIQTSNGEYVIVGYIKTISNEKKIYLVKTNSFGDTLWTKTFGHGISCSGYSVKETNDGGFIITGWDTFSNGLYTMVLIKTDGNGNMLSVNKLPIQNKNRKLVKIIDLLGREINKPSKNLPFIEVYDDGTTKKKMIID